MTPLENHDVNKHTTTGESSQLVPPLISHEKAIPGGLRTMVINHLLAGMILQAGIHGCIFRGRDAQLIDPKAVFLVGVYVLPP